MLLASFEGSEMFFLSFFEMGSEKFRRLDSFSRILAVAALGAFKNAIYDDPFSRLSDWNPNDENPCKWTGVRCSSYPQSSVIFM